MDQLDFKILNILLEDIRTPIKTIAERVFLSQAAVSQRISAMRSNGILLPSHAAIDPAALGYHFRCFIDIRVPSGLCAEFEAYLRNSDNIIEATYTTGENTPEKAGTYANSTDCVSKYHLSLDGKILFLNTSLIVITILVYSFSRVLSSSIL